MTPLQSVRHAQIYLPTSPRSRHPVTESEVKMESTSLSVVSTDDRRQIALNSVDSDVKKTRYVWTD
jgi:hypothetical protein